MTRRTRRGDVPAVFCVGVDGAGCPTPGECPGDAAPVVVYPGDAAPVVRDLCNWCWIAEREAHVWPCSVCGATEQHLPQFSRWWHLYSPHGMVRDSCARCLRPLPGACSKCITTDAWTDLAHGRLADRAGDCTCWRERLADAADLVDDDPAPAPAAPVDETPAPIPAPPAAPADLVGGVQLDMFGEARGVSCPHCGARRTYSDGIDDARAARRVYTCDNCRRTWSVDGAQLDMFE